MSVRAYGLALVAAIAVGGLLWSLLSEEPTRDQGLGPATLSAEGTAGGVTKKPSLGLAGAATTQPVSDTDPDVEESRSTESQGWEGMSARRTYPPAISPATVRKTVEQRKRSDSARDDAAASRKQERADDEPPPDPYAIAGRVLDDAGAAVAGIEVTAELRRLYTLAEGVDESEIERTQSARTGYGGGYYFPGLADGEYQLRTAATDRYTEARATVRAGVGSADLVVRRKLGQLQVYGQIQTAKGNALEDVQVLPLTQPPAVTYSDASGAYLLELDLAGTRETYPVRFRRDGYEDQTFALEPAFFDGFDAVPLDVTLEPLEVTGRVSGKVTTSAGKPVAGELVKLFSRERSRTYTILTDEMGRFAFADVVPASDYWIEVRPTGGRYKDYKRTGLKVGDKALEVPVVLRPLGTATLSGRIVDVHDNPVPYFTLWLRSRRSVGDTLQVTSDEDGRFLAEDVPAGLLSLESGASPAFEINGIHLLAGTEREIDLVVDWGDYALRGQIVDASGRPVPGANVSLFWSLQDGVVGSTWVRRTVADARGQFGFTRLGPGPHRVTVGGLPGFADFQAEYAVGKETDDVLVQLLELDW